MNILLKRHLVALAVFLLPCCALSASSTVTPTYHHKPHHYQPVNESNYADPIISMAANHLEMIGALGIGSVTAGNAYLGVTSSEVDELVQTNKNRWKNGSGQVGVGYVYYLPNKQRFSPFSQWFSAIEPELNFYYSPLHIKGNVWRFSDPRFNEFNYTSTVDTSRLMLDAALTVLSRARFSLFAIGGIGEAWTKVTYSDSGNANNPCALSAVTLKDRDQTHFAWEAGVGVTYLLSEAYNYRYNFSLQYLYTDFGSLSLPQSVGGSSLTAPVISPSSFTLHTQSILLGLHVGLA